MGQVLQRRRVVVTDFDGNPILRAQERTLPIRLLSTSRAWPSRSHSAIVARKHTHLDAAAVAEVDTLVRGAFLRSYVDRIMQLGHAGLYDPGPLHARRGGNVPGAQYNLRYPGDSDDVVRLLSEVLVPELIAARAWQTQRM